MVFNNLKDTYSLQNPRSQRASPVNDEHSLLLLGSQHKIGTLCVKDLFRMVPFLNGIFFSILGLLCLVVLRTLQIAYRRGIRRVPGPWPAKFSILYRISMVIKGKAVEEYLEIHRRYGSIVRVGPRHVSINDPSAIQQIYGISSKFRKVDWPTDHFIPSISDTNISRNSTLYLRPTMKANNWITCSL